MAISALNRAQGSAETAAHNIANVGTTGFKRRIEFSQLLAQADSVSLEQGSVIDFRSGHQVTTGNAYDLVISGEGFFVVRGANGEVYTRDGQFHRDPDGRLLNSVGQALQVESGGDLVLRGTGFRIATDGVVTEDGAVVARVAIVDFKDRQGLRPVGGAAFAASSDVAEPVDSPSLRQGALESANVATGDEMVSMMAALRRAETGQHLVQLYDDLMGRALSTFGQVTG